MISDRRGSQFVRVILEIDGMTYQTVDHPEYIGEWIARIWNILGPRAPYTSATIRIQ